MNISFLRPPSPRFGIYFTSEDSFNPDYYQVLHDWLPCKIIHVNGLNNDFNFR